MFKESLIFVILSVIIYQLYIVYSEQDKKIMIKHPIINNSTRQSNQPNLQKIENNKPMQYEKPQTFEHPILGKPTKIIQDGYLYIINNPQPWNAIVYNPNKEIQYLFIIKLILDNSQKKLYNDKINKWGNIIHNIKFNTESNELIIPENDANVALGIANLVINNLKGDLVLKNIIDNNLLNISISRIQSHSSVKNKIIDQILENNNNNQLNATEENLEYVEDLAETINTAEEEHVEEENVKVNHNVINTNTIEDPFGYEGNEFSYL